MVLVHCRDVGSSYPTPKQIWKVTNVGKACNNFQKLALANEGLDAAEQLDKMSCGEELVRPSILQS